MYVFQLIKKNHVEYSSANPYFCLWSLIFFLHSPLWSMGAALSHGDGLFSSRHMGGFKTHRTTMIEARAGHFLMRNCWWMPDLTRQQRLISTTATLRQFNKVLNIFEPSIHFLKPWTWRAILGLSAVSRGQAGTNLWGLKGWSRKYVLIWALMSQLRIHRSNKSGSYKVFTQLSC